MLYIEIMKFCQNLCSLVNSPSRRGGRVPPLARPKIVLFNNLKCNNAGGLQQRARQKYYIWSPHFAQYAPAISCALALVVWPYCMVPSNMLKGLHCASWQKFAIIILLLYVSSHSYLQKLVFTPVSYDFIFSLKNKNSMQMIRLYRSLYCIDCIDSYNELS